MVAALLSPDMVAREVLPGTTYLVTRRCVGRFYLFRPDQSGAMQAIFAFLLAVISSLFGITVHAAVCVSTHYHLVITDHRGVFPKFLHQFNRLLAVVTQCHRGWGESVFNRSQTSMVELPTAKIIINKMAYAIVNPVAAGAVRFHGDWPGFVTRVRDIGTTMRAAARPRVFLQPEHWADKAALHVQWPKLVLDEYGSIEAARTALQREVERLEKKAQAEIEAKGWKFLGADRCMKTRITKRAKAYEVWGSRNPTFADGGDPAIRELMIERRQTFRSRYNQNLASWRAGNRNVVFPPGTWKMHVLHRARRHPPPPR